MFSNVIFQLLQFLAADTLHLTRFSDPRKMYHVTVMPYVYPVHNVHERQDVFDALIFRHMPVSVGQEGAMQLANAYAGMPIGREEVPKTEMDMWTTHREEVDMAPNLGPECPTVLVWFHMGDGSTQKGITLTYPIGIPRAVLDDLAVAPDWSRTTVWRTLVMPDTRLSNPKMYL
jgi:hypothetical protein